MPSLWVKAPLAAKHHVVSGGLIMSASHNPGGPKEDWGIKFNYSSGEPAPERITDAIYKYTQSIKELKTADLPDIDLAKIGNNKFGGFEVLAGLHLSQKSTVALLVSD
jgi:phosphoglucomutase